MPPSLHCCLYPSNFPFIPVPSLPYFFPRPYPLLLVNYFLYCKRTSQFSFCSPPFSHIIIPFTFFVSMPITFVHSLLFPFFFPSLSSLLLPSLIPISLPVLSIPFPCLSSPFLSSGTVPTSLLSVPSFIYFYHHFIFLQQRESSRT